jgi:hypothetical protein
MTEPPLDRLDLRVSHLEDQVAELQRALGEEAGAAAEEESAPPPPPAAVPAPAPAPERVESQPVESQPQERSSADGGQAPSVAEWFEQRGFAVELAEETPADGVYDRLAEYLGDNFADLEKFLRSLRWTLREGSNGLIGLRNVEPSERQHTLEFAGMLSDRALLAHYNHNRAADKISFRASDDQRFQQFVNGYWLERYAYVKTRQTVAEKTPSFASARNLMVRGPELPRFEMDGFFLVDGAPICIECKSRDYRRDIDKYVNRSKAIGIPLQRTFLVVQFSDEENPGQLAEDLSALSGLSVMPTDRLTSRLQQMLSDGEVEVAPPSVDSDLVEEISEFLRGAQLAPCPEGRAEILAALAEVAASLPATLGDIRERVRAAVRPELETYVHPVLVAVRRGGAMLTSSGRPYRGTELDTQIIRLEPDDVLALDALCRAAYEEAIVRKMPEVASRPNFAGVFEQVVATGSPALA